MKYAIYDKRNGEIYCTLQTDKNWFIESILNFYSGYIEVDERVDSANYEVILSQPPQVVPKILEQRQVYVRTNESYNGSF